MKSALMKKTPIAMISPGRDLVEEELVVLKRAADPRGAQAEQDEDRREARHEEQAGNEHAAPVRLLQVRRGDPGHCREIARDEGQNAW